MTAVIRQRDEDVTEDVAHERRALEHDDELPLREGCGERHLQRAERAAPSVREARGREARCVVVRRGARRAERVDDADVPEERAHEIHEVRAFVVEQSPGQGLVPDGEPPPLVRELQPDHSAQRAMTPARSDAPRCGDAPRELEVMDDREHARRLSRRGEHLVGLHKGHRERFLGENVFAHRQRRQRQLVMGHRRRADAHRVEIAEPRIVETRRVRHAEPRRRLLRAIRAAVDDACERQTGRRADGWDVPIDRDPAAADRDDADRAGGLGHHVATLIASRISRSASRTGRTGSAPNSRS